MHKLYGYAGKLLRLDLTNERVTEEVLEAETARKYIGGAGFGAKYLYEEVPAGVAWSDEANRLVIASGPLGGTRISGSGTFCVVSKGALSNGATSPQAVAFSRATG
jgi:aldehyde:ferredoxin oxidoreductase